MLRGGRENVAPASVRMATISTTVALLLLALWFSIPADWPRPLMHAAFGSPLSGVDGWQLLAGWSGAVGESGLIACVGSGLIALASFVRRAM